ncbi:MAG: S9 family peptidase [Verrucomicrobiota bacterium]|nr:S9 family peptidase [Verrucomicrobiota bacterium]
MNTRLLHPTVTCLIAFSSFAADAPKPSLDPTVAEPLIAARKPKVTGLHGDKIDDPYFWLRHKEDPEVIAHLKGENAYTAAVMAPFQSLEDTLYREMLGRIKQTDVSAPYSQRGYWLYQRTEEGKQYPIYCRRKGPLDASEEVVLDVNQLARGEKFMALGSFEYSDDNTLLAYSTDVNGHRDYDFHLTNLATGEEIKTPLGKVADLVWAADNRTLFFTTENEAKRDDKLWRYTLGEREPTLLYEEKDELFDVGIDRTRDGKILLLGIGSSRTTEFRFLAADKPKDEWQMLAGRRNQIEYYPEHRDGIFYIRTNDGAKEFRVVTASVPTPGVEHWKEFIPSKPGVTLEDFQTFAKHSVVEERAEGLVGFRVTDFENKNSRRIELPEQAYSADTEFNMEFETGVFRFKYQSPVTPPSVFEYSIATNQKKLIKQVEVLGDYDPARYVVERVRVTAKDGKRIPLDIVRRKDVPVDGSAACWLYGYGSYGISIDPSFSSNRISLLDRGVIYAIAHTRGGGELGEAWHEDGRMTSKMNTFTDFIACGEYLVEKKYSTHEHLVLQGGSAGGLLVGATINLRPDLASVAILDVPFVDVINTMSDATLPLTTGEYIEWGNPNNKAEYDYMKGYSPYDNIAARDYPALLLVTSLNDSQVPYWEAAKFAAKLRAAKTDTNPLLLKINLDAGHGGASGRYDRLREVAFEYAFGLAALGLANGPNALPHPKDADAIRTGGAGRSR